MIYNGSRQVRATSMRHDMRFFLPPEAAPVRATSRPLLIAISQRAADEARRRTSRDFSDARLHLRPRSTPSHYNHRACFRPHPGTAQPNGVQWVCIAPHRRRWFRNVGAVACDSQANYDPYDLHDVYRRRPEAKPSLTALSTRFACGATSPPPPGALDARMTESFIVHDAKGQGLASDRRNLIRDPEFLVKSDPDADAEILFPPRPARREAR